MEFSASKLIGRVLETTSDDQHWVFWSARSASANVTDARLSRA